MMFSLAGKMIALLLLSMAFALGGCDTRSAAVIAADEAVDEAIDSGDGDAAAAMITKGSLARIERLLAIARTAKKNEVKALPFNDRHQVLQMRLLLKGDIKKPIDARTYYSRLIASGWTGSTSGLERGKITFDSSGTHATIAFKLPDDSGTMLGFWEFEDGVWKEDQVADSEHDDGRSRAAAQDLKMTEDEYLVHILKEASEEEVPANIWDAPK